MAKVSSARPFSRGSSAPAARITRATRSQSREPAEPLQAARVSPRKASQATPKTTPKKRGRPAKNATELDTVNEDAGAEAQVAVEMSAILEEPVEELELARRTSRASAMSGTTAQTSFSQEEIDALDAEVIVGVFPSLLSASNQLVKPLVTGDAKARMVMRKEIRTDGSKHNKLYKAHAATIGAIKQSFGSTEYIQPSIILRVLLNAQNVQDVPQGPWRPDSVIYTINLASMLRTVLISVPDNVIVSDEAYSALSRLADLFPTTISGPGFKEVAFHLSLDILTQLTIIRLHRFQVDPSFNGEDIIFKTFYELDDDEKELYFRHGNDLCLTELPAEEQARHSNTIRTRVNDLLAVLESHTPAAALASVRAQYKWEAFVEQVVQYYFQRKLELDEQIVALGGVDQIMLELSQEVERRANTREAEIKRQSLTRPGSTPKQGFGKAGIRRMKEAEARLAVASTAPAAPIAVMGPIADMVASSTQGAQQREASPVDDWQRVEDDEYPDQPTQAQTTARSTLAALRGVQATQRQNAAKGKARSFNEPQPGAVRVSFDDSQPIAEYEVPSASAPAKAPYYQSPQRSQPKRRREEDDEEDFEPTQDDGFEVDTRSPAAAEQRRRAVPQQRASQSRFTFADFSSAPEPSTAASPLKRQRKNPGNTIPGPMAPLAPEDNQTLTQREIWERARVLSRQNTATSRSQKPPQKRRPWEPIEEEALIDLIVGEGADGLSWQRLKAIDSAMVDDQRLSRRSAEDMRFKARNMKVTFLKSGVPLPPNFHLVQLDKKAIDQLHNHGIAYEQDQMRVHTAEINVE